MTCSCTIKHNVPGPFAEAVLEVVTIEDPDCPKHRPRTLRQLVDLHQFEQWHDGDGYSEPRNDGYGCSCGFVYDDHIQHRDCTCDFPEEMEQRHAEHLLAVAVRARLARSRGGAR
ncbi:hypothetical protein KNU09_gp86 [Gordonia phage TillyBobJoe]|uniref:Uncharacterized protein n=4 Tax=Wizardvirus TaxID=2169658 RepID=A0A385DS92_9CAUD|nr:hypothetical protein KNT95_gp88 [Gordonia phage Danyall]YP_010098249.1 hypothetical protein KNU09_gp86 [Gordonia phage TillyBobJoe]YP_010100889.1 hypothetical protein KNU39_gp87 [Gordonia phage Mutzi]YP_010102244.1 hypothetical protein KNU55_gp91 [Gordonia phage Barb]QWY84773.1 hypothetical protein SEA_YUNGMONEY_87 [Gordonia phage YungMoney]QXO14469.1 hypothetical protein SEA_FUGAX_91 [Gordonia phage Fugax]QZD98836.1 hypothetical protein SEA_PINKCOFFEE_89 [Gordonia phage PinkCoffee]WNM732